MRAADLPTVYGASYSVYVQALRLTLWAKGVGYNLVEVDAWTEGKQPAYLTRHPFGRIPAFQHGDAITVTLYEIAELGQSWLKQVDARADPFHTVSP